MDITLKSILVPVTGTILNAVEAIDRGRRQIALVIDNDGRLVGAITDGDVRRGLLRSIGVDRPLVEIMNPSPISVTAAEGREGALRLMRQLSIHQVPVVDATGKLVGLEWLDELVGLEPQDSCVVLMAGGLGVRLRPLTETVPKPMLPVGGRPLLESIVRNFAEQGYRRFFISVNHRREVIQNHFGDGTGFDVRIDYLVEEERLGTAGALSLLPQRPKSPIIVMNGDLLTSVRLDDLLRFHADQKAEATICAREFVMQVPYGVVTAEGSKLLGIKEKPTQSYFVNAGIYALSPSVFDLIEPDQYLDMPDLFERVNQAQHHSAVFPLREYWMDIGHLSDLERARSEYDQVFGK